MFECSVCVCLYIYKSTDRGKLITGSQVNQTNLVEWGLWPQPSTSPSPTGAWLLAIKDVPTLGQRAADFGSEK
jgi:hypothetical protein